MKSSLVKIDNTFDPSQRLWLKNIGIVMKFCMNEHCLNLNHITKFCYGRSIIDTKSKTEHLKKKKKNK